MPQFNFESRASLLENALVSCTFFDNDAAITAINTPSPFNCADLAEIVPSVRLTNFGFLSLTTVKIAYQINNGPPVSINYMTNLDPGESEDVNLTPFITPPPGTYEFRVYTLEPNGEEDEQMANDTLSSIFTTLGKQAFGNALFEDFTADPSEPEPLSSLNSGMVTLNPDNDDFEWEWSPLSTPILNIQGSIRFKNYVDPQDAAGRRSKRDYLLSPNYDFTNITGAKISFDLAYAQWIDNAMNPNSLRSDSLFVIVSTDCGSTFDNVVFETGGAEMATSAPTNAQFIPVLASQWDNIEVDLSAFSGLPNVTIAIANQSDLGNYLYLDNINIVHDNSCFLNVAPMFTTNKCADACDGRAFAIVTGGGVPPYTYQWSPDAGSQTTATAEGLCVGSYNVTITDDIGCSRVSTAIVNSNPPIIPEIEVDNASCGTSDGSIKVTASGGSDRFVFILLTPRVRQNDSLDVNNLAAGTYEVIVRDFIHLCTDTVEIEIINDSDTELAASSTPVSCFGTSSGTATVVPTGSSASYTYLWDDPSGQEDPTATGLAIGTYTVTVTDDNNCSSTTSIEVTGPPDIELETSSTDSGCAGTDEGSATVSASGGTVIDAYRYLWDDPAGQTTPTATGLAAGTYTVTVTDDQNCTKTASVEVGGATAIELTIDSTPASCGGVLDGTASVSASGGTVNIDYNYEWDDPNGQTTAVATGLAAGTYNVTVTDDNDCSATEQVIVSQPTAIQLTAFSTDPSCFDEASGTATAEASGGTITIDYTYLWDDPSAQETSVATGLRAGTYTVIVTDDNGCSETRSVEINQPEELLVAVSATRVGCNGGDTGSATATPSGGTVSNTYAYLWDDPSAQETQTATGLIAGTYTVTVTDDNGCSKIESIEVLEPDVLSVQPISVVHVSCNGGSDGRITLETTGGSPVYTYNWEDDPTRTGNEATGLETGTYNVTVTDVSDCDFTLSIRIDEPDGVDLDVSSTDITMVGANDGTANADASGGTGPYTYLWDIGATTPFISDLEPGVYCVTVTDRNNCSNESCITVNDVNCPTITVEDEVVNITCFGLQDGQATVTASGGAEPYEYAWNDAEGQSTPTATGLAVGLYQVTITDQNGCEVIREITIEGLDELVASGSSTAETTAGANDGTATADVSGGTLPYDYDWGMAGSTPTVTGLMPGTYTCTITDANNCVTEVTVVVAPGTVDCTTLTGVLTKSDALCFGLSNGTATVDPSGGTPSYTYLWNDPDGQETATATGLPAGTYSVTVTDANGCNFIDEITVAEPDQLILMVGGTNETVAGNNDGTATATASGGTPPYVYDWGLNGMGETITGLAPGTYTATVTDANGCAADMFIVIETGAADCSSFGVQMSSTNVTCNGAADGTATATPENGTPAYTYLWSDPMAQETQTATGLEPGIYNVTITDANDCETVGEVEITEPQTLVVTVNTTDESSLNSMDGTADANVNGGTAPYSFLWSNNQDIEDLTDLVPGTYCVTVTDINGCTSEACGTVNPFECDTPTINFNTTSVSCFGGSDGTATALVIGSNGPYTFLWSNDQEDQTATGLEAGLHQVTVTDAGGCVTVAEVTIEEPTALELSISSTNETVGGANDGTATATPSGGTMPYTYAWEPGGGMTDMIAGLTPGVYNVTVTDAEGCTIEGEVEIEAGTIDCSSLEVEVSAEDVRCNGESNGTATATASGGTGPYSYLWSDDQETATAVGLAAGIYRVTVTDVNNCTVEEEVTVNQPSVLVVSATATNETSAGANDGTATANPMGGSMPYTYNWVGIGSTQTVTGLASGTYTVIVTDANGCTAETMVMVMPGQVDCSDFSIEVSGEDVQCFGDENGTATVTTQNGQFPFTYSWSNGAVDGTIFNLAPATYQVTVIDNNNCLLTGEVTIGEPSELTITAVKTDETVDGANDGTATANPSGGTTPYSYLWSDTYATEIQTVENLAPGIYEVTVTDDNGCTAVTEVEIEKGTFDCSNLGLDVITVRVTCFGGTDGSATLEPVSAADPFVLTWPDGSNDLSRDDLEAGSYVVTLVDAEGCELEETIVIGEPAPMLVTIDSEDETIAGLEDGKATALVSGGTGPYTYEWSNMEMTAEIENLAPGMYQVTVTDVNGCTGTSETEISLGSPDCSQLMIELDMVPVSCPGGNDGMATLVVEGNQGNVDISWSNGGFTATIDGLLAGTYRVDVTDDLGCTVSGEIVVTQPAPFTLNMVGSNGTCGSLATARAGISGGTGPYRYRWSTGETTNIIRNLNTGSYQVTITDSNDCTTTGEVAVEVEEGGIEVVGQRVDVSCFGESDGSITLDLVEGNPPYTFNWNNGETTQSIDNLPAGNYIVQIQDAAGCSFVTSFVINQPQEIFIDFQDVKPTMGQGNNGSLTANVSGGATPYTYLWNTGSMDLKISNLSEGTYYLTVTDGNGCEKIDSFELTTFTVGLEELQSLQRFDLYPNPTQGRTHVLLEFDRAEAFRLEVFDLVGQRIYTYAEKSRQLQKEIYLDQFPAGTYLVRVRTDRGQAVRKLVLME
ncbi:MAG: T9SS type A sorting domain-containing protein [Bacteroidota bacterium]